MYTDVYWPATAEIIFKVTEGHLLFNTTHLCVAATREKKRAVLCFNNSREQQMYFGEDCTAILFNENYWYLLTFVGVIWKCNTDLVSPRHRVERKLHDKDLGGLHSLLSLCMFADQSRCYLGFLKGPWTPSGIDLIATPTSRSGWSADCINSSAGGGCSIGHLGAVTHSHSRSQSTKSSTKLKSVKKWISKLQMRSNLFLHFTLQ